MNFFSCKHKYTCGGQSIIKQWWFSFQNVLFPKSKAVLDYTRVKTHCYLITSFLLLLKTLSWSLKFCVQILWQFSLSIIALNKLHDFQCLYLIKIMSKSKTQKTTADAAVNHPNAWSSWLKPAAAIEAAINIWQMVPKPTVAPNRPPRFPSFLPPLPTSSLMTKPLFLEMLILLEQYVNSIKTHHNWIYYWLVNQKKRWLSEV